VKLFDRIREWASSSDGEKVQLERRMFLKGLAVTSAGLLVPGAAVFDMGRSLHVDGNLNAFDPDAQRRAVDDFMREGPPEIGHIQIMGDSHFGVGDLIQISGAGNENDGKYIVSAVGAGDMWIAEAPR
jgi:hypothetical protein